MQSNFFIRGQDEIALYEGKGNGRILTSEETCKFFSPQLIEEIYECGTAIISAPSLSTPSILKKQRERLHIRQRELATRTMLSIEDIKKAENEEYESDFSVITKICKTINLDEYCIGHKNTKESKLFARYLRKNFENKRISREDILNISECGWVAHKQLLLQEWLNVNSFFSIKKKNNYDFKNVKHFLAYSAGCVFAERFKQLCNIDFFERIYSMRNFLYKLNIPYIFTKLSMNISHVTITIPNFYCIIVNINGKNKNFFTRRFSAAYGLAYLFWDILNKQHDIHINKYDDIDIFCENLSFVDLFAKGFAAELLMPSMSIANKKYNEKNMEYIQRMMMEYGIPFFPTLYHLYDNCKIGNRLFKYAMNNFTEKSSKIDTHWKIKEDILHIHNIPLHKRNFFVHHVCEAFRKGIISKESFSVFLT